MKNLFLTLPMMTLLLGLSSEVLAIDQPNTVKALRLANTITGGTMPTSDPLFAQMVVKIQSGDSVGAANIAASSKYFANYLARRLAFQMQNTALDATATTDGDATAFLIAHFTGFGGKAPSISTIWSENMTYLVNFPVSGVPTVMHDYQVLIYTGQNSNSSDIDWSTQIVQGGPQMAAAGYQTQAPTIYTPIPAKHVGGYLTASTSPKGQSIPDYSLAALSTSIGTNLRMIEGLWEISTGLTLVDFEDTDFASTDLAKAQGVPRFVPEDNPNFYVGQGQTACIACHGGGLSSLKHGYATVADIFDYAGPNGGFVYNDPSGEVPFNRKSLGSTTGARSLVLACTASKPSLACNPDSAGTDPNQAWDLSSWKATGILDRMGWTGPVVGDGLNSLGQALGRASIVYENFTKRIIGEICPLGTFTATDVSQIANAANPYAVPVPGSDDIRTIVALVAAHPTCQ